jgi:anti-anti-sigma regulatory factor
MMANWTFDKKQRMGKLMVEEGLTIAQVCQLKEALLRGLDEAGQVVLDIGAAGDIDVAGLQLLCAAHRFAKSQGKELLLTGVDDHIRELAGVAGFAHGTMCGGGNDSCFWSKVA